MKNKSFSGLKKKALICILMSVIIFNFIFPPHSKAIKSEIADTFQSLMCWIGDSIINLLQEKFMGEPAVFEGIVEYQQRINQENVDNAQGFFEKAAAHYANFMGQNSIIASWQAKFSGTESNYAVALIQYSVPAIVSNQIEAFNVNFFKTDTSSATEEDTVSTVKILKSSIQKWYYAFRNLAIIALLSILLYLGIKIVLSSVASEKAKYKQNLLNWLMAVVLVFSMHYIMAFTLNIIDQFNEVLKGNVTIQEVDEEGNPVQYDQLMGSIRVCAEEATEYGENLSYTLLYCVLVAYTCIFTFIYFKRTIYVVFLTIIAPLVAITYPLDKEKDGKSQAFDMWFKEYLFNALLQPIHLLLYYVLVSSAQELVAKNLIYAIVAIGFMIPGEKIIRKMFGMENYGEASALGSFTGGVLAASALGKLRGVGKNLPKGRDNTNGEENNSNIKMAKLDDVFGNDDGSNQKTSSSNIRTQAQPKNNATSQPSSQNSKTQITSRPIPKLNNNTNTTNVRLDSNEKNNRKSQTNVQKEPSVKNGAKAVAKAGGRYIRKNAGKIATTAISGTAGAVGLTAGIATGIATGDLGNVVKYGALGAGAGSGAAKLTIKGATSAVKGTANFAKGAKEAYQKGYYGDDAEYQRKVLIPKLKEKNEKNKELQEKYAKEGIDMKASTGRAALYQNGYVNESDILKALKVQKSSGMSDQELVQDAIMAKHFEKLSDTSSIQEELKNRLKQKGLEESKVDEEVKRRMKDIKKMAGLN